jgi:hypothetical protein
MPKQFLKLYLYCISTVQYIKKKSLDFQLNFFKFLASFSCTWNRNRILNTVPVLETCVSDPHPFYADPDPT